MNRADYRPSAAFGARVEKQEKVWTLVVVRDLKHPPEKVWDAITDPAQLREWAPYDSDRSLAQVGTAKLTTIGTPQPLVSDSEIKRAEKPKLLELNWGHQQMRWELEAQGTGTRLTLWHSIDKNFVSMGAAGWHICFDVLDQLLAGSPLGRIVAGDAMKFEWPRLNDEYAKQFGVETPSLGKR